VFVNGAVDAVEDGEALVRANAGGMNREDPRNIGFGTEEIRGGFEGVSFALVL
jgi:hypothetical protein